MTIDNQFIRTHAHIVRCIAKQFSNNTNDRQDLMQEGYIGLMEAAKKYDPDTGVRFDSYAGWWVRKYMREYIIRHGQAVSLPFKTRDYHRSATLDMDRPLYHDENGPIRFADLLTDGSTPETGRIRQEEHQRLNEAIEKLSARERQIICKIYGIDCEAVPMKELAKKMGLSYDRVKKIHAKCVRKLSEII